MKLTAEKKITRATFKTFVNEHRDQLLINVTAEVFAKPEYKIFVPVEMHYYQNHPENRNTFGLKGIWLVNSSRDTFSFFQDGDLMGIHVCNCCGSFTIAIFQG